MKSGALKDFYNGKTIFLTGGSGFIGKILLSKLMRLGNVKEILVFLRPKKGKSHNQRLDEMLNGFLFQSASGADPHFRRKLKVIIGDLESHELGISSVDRDYIQANVQIIIHAAATVRFDEEIKKAISINIYGTRNVLELAKGSKCLQSLVYFSTAYSQCPRLSIDEVFYETPMDYRKAIDLMGTTDNNILKTCTRKLICPWPNTYTFTKAVAEDMIRQYQHILPIAIIRPSIVVGTIKEPVPGYSDTILAGIGVWIGYISGVVRIYPINVDACLNSVGADVVVNTTLAIPLNQSQNGSKEIIYNCTFQDEKVNAEYASQQTVKWVNQYPTKRMVWRPILKRTEYFFIFTCLFVLYHCLFASIADFLLYIRGRKLRYMSIYRKVYSLLILLFFFGDSTWNFDNSNTRKLHETLLDEEERFSFKYTLEEHDLFYKNQINGIRKYFYKENDEDLKYARKKLRYFKIVDRILMTTIYSTLAYIAYKISLRWL